LVPADVNDQTRSQFLRLLALDTSTPRGSVALLSDQEVVAEFRLASLESHSGRLLKSIDFLLESASWEQPAIEVVAVGIGPGSFTGIRVGISTALGLAQTLNIPFAGISGLEALAQQSLLVHGRVGVIQDAHRGQVYFQPFDSDGSRIVRAGSPRLVFPEELKALLHREKFHVLGDGAVRYIETLKDRNKKYPVLVQTDLFLAGSIGRLALARKRAWRTGEGLKCDPLYIRPPDARKPKGP
jgi:tRNA threonylcarbamoyladenosine biosynthesis protein TsaB